MSDDVPLPWVEAPPAPPAPPPVVDDALAHLRADGAVTLAGSDGSGRRTAALHVVATLEAAHAYLVPGVPWRAPEALREIGRRLDTRMPPELPPQTIVKLAHAAMTERDGGVLVVDARIQADPGLLAALRPPAGWRAILLAPGDIDAATAWGAIVPLASGDPPPALTGDDGAVLAAASYFDPWEGAPRPLLAAVADRSPEVTDAAIERLLTAGRLRPSRDRDRVLPTLHDYQARPEVSDPRERPFAERYVAAIAALCGRTKPDEPRALAPDRGNVMTALSLWPSVSPPGLVAGFALALPMLLDDRACHEAAKLIIDASRYGDAAAQQAISRAQRRLDGA